MDEPKTTGIFSTLSPEKQAAVLAYRGPENHGDPTIADEVGVLLCDHTAEELAREVVRLREKTANHIGFTDERTGKRIKLYAPDTNSFEIALYDPEMNDILRSIHRQLTDGTAKKHSSFPDSGRKPRDIREILQEAKSADPATDLYFECHVTIEPVFDDRREQAKSIASRHGFRMAELLMRKRSEDTETRSAKDSFMTGHSKTWEDIVVRMTRVIQDLRAEGFEVWRYKIEDTLLDSRSYDKLGLLQKKEVP